MSNDCIFCKIVAGDIPAEIVYSDDLVVAFRDLNPQAPTHLLVIPRKHVAMVADADSGDSDWLAALFLAAGNIARDLGFEDAFRLAMNNGAAVGQSVFHVHLHLLAGRSFNWPPG